MPLSTLSLWLKRAVGALMVLLPLLVFGWLIHGMADPSWLALAFPDLPPGTALTATKSSLALGLGAVTLIPALAALGQMRGLLGLYARGEILSPPCARHIARSGFWLAVLAVVQVVIYPAQIVMMTLDNPQGSRAIGLARAGFWLAVLAVAQVVLYPAQIVALTLDNPQGSRAIGLALSSETLWLLLAGGLLAVIGRVMAEAVRVAEENAGFI